MSLSPLFHNKTEGPDSASAHCRGNSGSPCAAGRADITGELGLRLCAGSRTETRGSESTAPAVNPVQWRWPGALPRLISENGCLRCVPGCPQPGRAGVRRRRGVPRGHYQSGLLCAAGLLWRPAAILRREAGAIFCRRDRSMRPGGGALSRVRCSSHRKPSGVLQRPVAVMISAHGSAS